MQVVTTTSDSTEGIFARLVDILADFRTSSIGGPSGDTYVIHYTQEHVLGGLVDEMTLTFADWARSEDGLAFAGSLIGIEIGISETITLTSDSALCSYGTLMDWASGILPSEMMLAVFLRGDDVLSFGSTRSNQSGSEVNGYAGDDRITGGRWGDVLIGGGGDDTLMGQGGEDTLSGGAGADRLVGGEGADVYEVDGGDTVVEGQGLGRDLVRSGAVSFVLGAQVEDLELTGALALSGTGNVAGNRLTGNAAANRLDGLSGADTLSGAAGNDSLFGGSDADSLSGGLGADVLRGGAGADILSGGGNDFLRDSFVFTAVSDSFAGEATRDMISDFQRGEDRIDLSLLDARAAVTGDQAFFFSGQTAAAHAVWYVVGSGRIVLRADVDGDASADFAIGLAGLTALTPADLVL